MPQDVFDLQSPYAACGDQPEAIRQLTARIGGGAQDTILQGVTGSGKTFTTASVIANLNRPTLVICHNKTLAAQLYSEFRQFFPKNAVEYFVSYFDYYQPEAYIPASDTYIEKDSSLNEEIERMRLSATSALLTRRDVVVVASVSCIYGLGSPEDYAMMICPVDVGMKLTREQLLTKLVEIHYERGDFELARGKFRVRGDVVEVGPATEEWALRIEFFGDEIERLTRIDPLTGETLERIDRIILFPARHYVTPFEKLQRATVAIRQEMLARIDELEKQGKLLESQRIKMRTTYDLELMEEMGFCNGIENYSRHLAGRPAGSRPHTLIDFFPKDFLTVIDESHATVPQIGGMFAGDKARKSVLVDHGFRLPSALDNRPLNFPEFEAITGQRLFVSATPGDYELNRTRGDVVEQIIRPTGLLDPEIEVRPLKSQIDDMMEEVRKRVEKDERSLVLTLTKRTAEDLTQYLSDLGIRVRYLHSEVDTIERVEILRGLRAGEFDVLVGINLLREGLDLPEVSLVGILDADKEGYLRSEKSLIQMAGRAARHVNGRVILYADSTTRSMQALLNITSYRRKRQIEYNTEHHITPKSVRRAVQESLRLVSQEGGRQGGGVSARMALKEGAGQFDAADLLKELQGEMIEASSKLEYEKAALLRDQISELKKQLGIDKIEPRSRGEKVSPVVYKIPKKSPGKKSKP
ncbi:Excinuclease ABC subunit B [Verrucomicrobium sp. GAS474]|uniref:excinuclease ABC subunit UvrB n=1 Tax=Verrucomicrobium sp. GAS474 TaxID=1882831 RepID=UPI00087D70CD|nr:excinuclease ABC subunit UvrB [Verrucomicrobium sp. GAS474]SDU19578.1 Excinuclease ABC subunit B [Verrucomicrobium sp. GAS474]